MFKSDESAKKRFSCALWGALNQTIITAGEDGVIRVWDVESGAQVSKVHPRPARSFWGSRTSPALRRR